MKTISRTEKYNAEPGKIFNYPDDPCVTGTHDATTIEMKKAYIIGGKEIPAGK